MINSLIKIKIKQNMAESLSDLTKAEYKKAFDTFDSNKDGLLASDDLLNLMNYLKFYPNQAELNSMIEEFTQGKNGEISFFDFLDIAAAKMFDENAENDLMQAFKIFDIEGRGQISALSLKKMLLEVDKDVTEEELHVLLRDLRDEEGQINYTKLVREFLFA